MKEKIAPRQVGSLLVSRFITPNIGLSKDGKKIKLVCKIPRFIQEISWGVTYNATSLKPSHSPISNPADYYNKELCSEEADREGKGEGGVPRNKIGTVRRRWNHRHPTSFSRC